MPDGDIFHNRLRRLYHKPYKWLCEGKATSDECARVVLESLKKDLIQKGDLPLRLCQGMADILAQAITTNDELESGNYAALSLEFDILRQQFDGRPDLKGLALDAGKSVLHDLRYGHAQEINISDASVVIVNRYMNGVYASEFKERVPLTSEHYAGIDQATLSERIKEIEPHIKIGISKFAEDAINKQSVAKLSLPRRSSRKAIDLDEDLLAG
ncbi:MAG: hypothetical protein KME15_12140 [Drouetiella hepatica Uher 2000/2452]|jgi:hypothetical protein|uniref:Uncharacterized protein n=1 Tax=Drouetiella hepatica Uher 2000/2452 TaxID=904376 RepID=A0A951QAT3_9CYAN|nr:hypothetical protein [Drouetiella hepatica Uher 2000/2452]